MDHELSPTKQKILDCAAELFAHKGFTETTIRNIATAVGLHGSSIYNHFASKNDILQLMLDDYSLHNAQAYLDKDISSILQNDPSANGILSCMQLAFPEGRELYYLDVLYVLMQEQHRNEMVRQFMSEQFILRIELNIMTVIQELIKLGIIRQDTDADFWMKASSSIVYAFASRRMLGIGDNAPDFTGQSMYEALWSLYDLLLHTCSVS